MTIYQIIKNKLQDYPSFRERKMRSKFLMKLALREMECEQKYYAGVQLSEEQMIDFAKKYDSYRHEWDAVLEDYPDLRGKDYADKKKVVQKKQIEFGYEGGYNMKVKV